MSGRIRRTSLDAWQKIQDEGLLRRGEWAVYDALYQSKDGLTRNELDSLLAPNKPNALYSRRLADLERFGAIERVDTRPCAVSGNPCEVWDVTDRLPVRVRAEELPPMPSTDQAPGLAAKIWDVIETRKRGGLPPDADLAGLHAWLLAGAPKSRRASRKRQPPDAAPAALPPETPPLSPPTPPAAPASFGPQGQGQLFD